jgi:hypothetical protein
MLWVSGVGKRPRTQQHMAQLKMYLDIERAKHLVFIYVVVPLMNYMSTKFKGAQDIFLILF